MWIVVLNMISFVNCPRWCLQLENQYVCQHFSHLSQNTDPAASRTCHAHVTLVTYQCQDSIASVVIVIFIFILLLCLWSYEPSLLHYQSLFTLARLGSESWLRFEIFKSVPQISNSRDEKVHLQSEAAVFNTGMGKKLSSKEAPRLAAVCLTLA